MDHDRVEAFIKKLDNLFTSDYYGLRSPGLTCYLNSVLQVLFMTQDFREAVKSKYSTNFDLHLRDLFVKLEKKKSKTHRITEMLDITDVYEQRDAAEYLEKILCQTSPKASKIFKGELTHKTTCHICNKSSESKSGFWILPLAVDDSCHKTNDVKRGLEGFFGVQKVCGDNQMYCEICKEKQDAAIECKMTQCPDVLTLLLKRFTFDYKQNCYVKLHCRVAVARHLQTANCRYDLYAVVDHLGDLSGGHYTADIKSFETGEWYCFNDSIVKMVGQLFEAGGSSFSSCTAYLLMYRKVREPSQQTDGSELEAHSDCLDVAGEEKRDEAEQGHAPVSDHQRRSENFREGDKKLHNGETSKGKSPQRKVGPQDRTGVLTTGKHNQMVQGHGQQCDTEEKRGQNNGGTAAGHLRTKHTERIQSKLAIKPKRETYVHDTCNSNVGPSHDHIPKILPRTRCSHSLHTENDASKCNGFPDLSTKEKTKRNVFADSGYNLEASKVRTQRGKQNPGERKNTEMEGGRSTEELGVIQWYRCTDHQ